MFNVSDSNTGYLHYAKQASCFGVGEAAQKAQAITDNVVRVVTISIKSISLPLLQFLRQAEPIQQ